MNGHATAIVSAVCLSNGLDVPQFIQLFQYPTVRHYLNFYTNDSSAFFSRVSAKAECDLSSLYGVCMYVDHFGYTPQCRPCSHTPSPGNGISTGNSLISSPNLDSPQKFSLDLYLFFKWMPSNNSDTNLFLILQNYLKPFQTWRPPTSPNHSVNQNAELKSHHNCSANQNAGI